MSGILVIGRLHFLVPSHSRPGVAHVVDLEPCAYGAYGCSCEAFTLSHGSHGLPCRHIEEVVEEITLERRAA